MKRLVPVLLTVLPALAGCDLFGGEAGASLAARREAESKAIGAGCRHAARAIEDCFALNRKADKAAVFAGWRDMNDYMRENKIDPVLPQGASTEVAQTRGAADAAEAGADEKSPAGDKPPAKSAPGKVKQSS